MSGKSMTRFRAEAEAFAGERRPRLGSLPLRLARLVEGIVRKQEAPGQSPTTGAYNPG